MIVTFYSYKGGVGRSMALCNIGQILCNRGRRVTVCDFDLEAPGLEAYLATDRLPVSSLREKKGIVDLLRDYQSLVVDDQLERKTDIGDATRLRSYLPKPSDCIVDLGDFPGRLALLTAGRRISSTDPRYAADVQRFNWNDFYEQWAGGAYLDLFRLDLEHDNDFVLIDSRTGLTEQGGVCTHHLADIVILLTGTNSQHLDGTKWMMEQLSDDRLISARSGRPLMILPISSRVEQFSEQVHLVKFRQRLVETFGSKLLDLCGDPFDYFVRTEIPYIPLYSFEERLVAREQETDRNLILYQSYSNIAFILETLASRLKPRQSRLLLAYSRLDIDFVNSLRNCLGAVDHSDGIRYYSDRDAAADSVWSDGLNNLIEQTDILILCLSQNYLSSRLSEFAIMTEFEAIKNHGGIIYGVLLDDCDWRGISIMRGAPIGPVDDRGQITSIATMQEHSEGGYAQIAEAVRQLYLDVRRNIFDKGSRRSTLGTIYPAILTLPASTADFTGREPELAHLANILAGGGRAGFSAVTGMGGVGKTALAVEAAWRAAESFPDGILFLDLGGFGPSPLAPEAALASLIAQIEPTLKPPEGLAPLGAAYRSLLAGRRMLLLLDNARDPAQLRPLLPPEPVALLATSRVPLRLPGVQPLELDALPEAEALTLLRSSLHGRTVDDTALSAIAAACARLPIALRAASAFFAERPSWTIADYLVALASKRLPHLASEDDPALDVATVLGFSVERLAAERPALAQRWRLLSIFPGDFAADAAAAVWDAEPRDAADDLGRLSTRSLLLHDATTGRWRLQALFGELAAEGVETETLEATRERHAEHYRGVLAKAGDLYVRGGDKVLQGLALFDLERPNIEAGQSWAASRMATHPPAARLAFAYTNAGVYVLELRLPPRQRIGWLEAAVAGCRQTGDRQGEGNALGNLGIAWAELGETRKAIGLHEQRLAIAREIGDRRGEGNALGNLGNAWAELGEPRKAIGLHEQLLAIAREIGDRRGEGAALGNLGIAWAALGEPRKAIGLYEQRFAISREIGDRLGEGAALGSLGLAWAALGEPRKAIGLYEQQLAITREIGDRRGEGNALMCLGIARDKLGSRPEAIESAIAALSIYRAIEDPWASHAESWLRERGIEP